MNRSLLEDVLPLTPLQEGMFFHAHFDDEALDVYNVQVVVALRGPLRPADLRTAAAALVRRHPNLRAGFRQRANGQPFQVIHREAPLPWDEVELTGDDRDAALDRLLTAERARRFPLDRPPLLRFTLVRLGPEDHRLVLTTHHMVVDGWSNPILLRELFTLYEHGGDDAALAPPVPYRRYFDWLGRQDEAASTEVWRRELAGLPGPCLVVPADPGRVPVMPARVSGALPADAEAGLDRLVAAHGLTVNTLVQGAWGVVLARLTGRDDVVFGTVVSGRPPEVDGIEAMVGMFINTIPVRVRLDPDAPVTENLTRLRTAQTGLLAHHHLRLAALQRAAGDGGDLFDTFAVFENYPSDGAARPAYAGLEVTVVAGHDAAHYPLRLIAARTGQRLGLELEYRPDLFDADEAGQVLTAVTEVLRQMTAEPGRTVRELAVPVPDAFRRVATAPAEPAAPAPAAEPAAPVAAVGPRPAQSATEEILLGLFEKVLGRPCPGVDAGFFDLGGQSLTAIRLLSQVRSAFGVELPVRAVFEAPTVAGLAARIARAGAARAPLTAVERPRRLPLSHAQRRLWFAFQLEGPSPTYNCPLALRLSGPLDADALVAAVGDVTERHEALRTRFAQADGEPYQVIASGAAARPEVARVTVAGEGALREALAGEAAHRFDLATGIPLKVTLYRVAEDEHVLLWLVHHIASDGWSMAPLARDLSVAYRARCAGAAPAWEPLPAQYADYALWQRDLLGCEDDPDSVLSRQLAYWEQTLAGAPELLELPLDRPRPAVASHRGDTVRFDLDAALHTRLAALARQSDVTMFMVLHAAVAVLLSRLGAGTDVPVSTVLAGRTDEALDDLVGFFVNTLVLRTDVSGDPTFRELLGRVRETDLAAFAHQDVPFERVVEALNPTRTLSHSPFTQVTLIVQNTGAASLELAGLTVSAEPDPGGVAKAELAFSLNERRSADGTPAGLQGMLEYALDLFEPESARRLTERLARLLDALAADPDRPVGQVEILSPAERRQLLGADAADRVPPLATFPELFERQARRTPDRPAVEAGATVWTYAELDARANRLARVLVAHGAAPEAYVAVAVPRGELLPQAVLAVMQSGAAYLPLDPDYPAQRLAAMVADASPALLVTTAAIAGRLPDTGAVPRLVLDDATVAAELAAAAETGLTDADRRSPLRPGHPAYVVFTSGSTGRPKGVVVTHTGIGALSANQIAHYRVGTGSRVLQFSSPSFDVSMAETALALLSGGCLVVPERTPAGAELTEVLAARRVSHLLIAPSALAEAPWADLPHLTTVITGAEALSAELAAFWGRDRLLINAYGPTEATCDVTFTPRDPRAPAGARIIGRPIDGVRAYVLDRSLNPVPPGVTGELYVSGPGLARGYLDRAELTAERFVADPYGAPGARMYRTGDLAAWRPGGALEFCGRADTQVKLRGFRVELAEVEAAVERCPGVGRAVAMVREDRPGDQRLVAYVQRDPGHPAPLVPGVLATVVADWLPAYMVPASFVTVDEWPLTPNGKLDRRALPAPAPVTGRLTRPPRSPQEELLCRLFAEVLGAEQVGVDDNFFELGGHSLLATRLVGRVRAVLGGALGLRDVFAAPTPARLAAQLAGGDASAFETLLPLRTSGGAHPLFCVHPVAGYAWRYSALLGVVDPGVPVYGLQARGLDGTGPLASSLEEMADDYIREMRTVQPEGPYHLLGLSLGGLMAQAVAARLQEQGHEVGLLVLLDSYPAPPDGPGTATDPDEILEQMHDGYAEIYGLPEGAQARPASAEETRTRVVDWLGRGTSELRHLDPEQRAASLDVMVNNVRMTNETRPRRFHGDLVLVVATRNQQPWAAPQAWKEFTTGEVVVHEVECEHHELLEPEPAAEIGRILAPRLAPGV
ncbi:MULTISPECIES: non-ribosomal peptide synthetase, partial [Streptomycetaceae]